MTRSPSAHVAEEEESYVRECPPLLAKVLTSNVTLWALVFLTIGIAISVGALSENRHLFDGDEEIYMRVIRQFADGVSVDLLRTYGGEPASPAPLFFMVYSWCGRLLGFSYPVFRGLSLFITVLATLWVSLLLRRRDPDDPRVYFPILVFLFPYIFCMAFAVMAEPLSLLFTVIGMGCYFQGLACKSDRSLLAGSVAITAALYVRIHASFAPVAAMLVLLLQKDRSALRWCLAGAPLVLRIPLVVLQGGLTVSREAFTATKPELGFCPSNINFFFVWFGYLFFPLLWWCKGKRWINLVVAFCLIPVYIVLAPDFLATHHNGALRTLFLRVGAGTDAARLLAFPAWFIGCYLTMDLIQRIVSAKHVRDMFFGACVVVFMVSLVFSTVAFERYYLLAVPAIVLMGVSASGRRTGYAVMAVWHILFLSLSAARLAT
ncbi:MAG: ArnT family glycosyltransferase, partial [Phycisphaerae bacterium]